MITDIAQLNESQKDAILDLDSAMKQLFAAFIVIDRNDIEIADALEMIGMDIPLFIQPAVNQLSGKLREMAEGDIIESE